MSRGRKSRRVHGKQILTFALTMLLVLGFGYYVINNGIVDDESIDEVTSSKEEAIEKIPQTREELQELLETLNFDSNLETAANIPNSADIKIPFNGFLRNEGQNSNEDILYYYSAKDSFIGFSSSKIYFRQSIYEYGKIIDIVTFDLSFVDSKLVDPTGINDMSHETNYYVGNLNLKNIASYEEIWFYDMYPNIDLRYYMSEEGLKYDFVVRPGGDPEEIKVKVSDEVKLEIHSSKVAIFLKINPDNVILVDNELEVFQENDRLIPTKFNNLGDDSYGFSVTNFDKTINLIIDPIWLGFSTYLGGGTGDDYGEDIAVDGEGNVYVTGTTGSSNFPLLNANQSTTGGQSDAFVTKLNSTGNGLIYSTYLGGGGFDEGYGIVVDGDGNAYVYGFTGSGNFPVTSGALNTTHNGVIDTFIAKFTSSGELEYNTFLGGGNEDYGYGGIAVDVSGNVYVAGYTNSSDFPTTTGANNETHNGGTYDIFVTKLNPTGDALIYSTFIGGSGNDTASDIVIDDSGNVYITGSTDSIDFPITSGAYNNTYSGGTNDTFVIRLHSSGSGLIYSTYLGGSGSDIGNSIALDSAHNAYITGYTLSTDFPMVNAYDNTSNGDEDVFVTKINSAGNGLYYSTYLGGNKTDIAWGIAVTSKEHVIITGGTISDDFPTTNEYQSNLNGNQDVFVANLNFTGDIHYSTYIGGAKSEGGKAIALDTDDNVYVIGSTSSTNFPTLNPYQTDLGNFDAILFKIDSKIFSTYLGGEESDMGYGIAVDIYGNIYVVGETLSLNFPTTLGAYNDTKNGLTDVFITKLNATGNGLIYSTYFGGSDYDVGRGIVVDDYGNAYLTGETWSKDFTVLNPYQTNSQTDSCSGSKKCNDVFITKFDSTGELVYSTYLGDDFTDTVHAIAIDISRNVYVIGETNSTDFPTKNPYQTAHPDWDIFVTKLNATGNGLVYSTYLGGNGTEYGTDIVIDNSGNAYITGRTSATDFPTTIGAYNRTYSSGTSDIFVAKLNSTGTGLNYSTYLGGSDFDSATKIGVDNSGNAYITGNTRSTDFPTTLNAYNRTFSGGISDIFVTKLNVMGTGLNYSTFIGGNSDDRGYSLGVDDAENVYIAGSTKSTNFPSVNAHQTYQGGIDAILVTFNSKGDLVYSSYLGGSSDDEAFEIAVDYSGNVYITGSTDSDDFPTINEYQSDPGDGKNDVFIVKLGAEFDNFAPIIRLAEIENNSVLKSGTPIDLLIYDAFLLVEAKFKWGENTLVDWSLTNQPVSEIDDKEHILYVTATDSAGNVNIATFYFTTDDTLPNINLQSPINNSIQKSNTPIELNITDAHLDTVFYNWNGGANQTLPASNQTLLPTNDTLHILNVYANDSAGNWNSSSYSFTTDDTLPSIILESPTDGGYFNNSVTIDLDISDTNLDTVLYNWNGTANKPLNGSLYTVPLPTDNGVHTLYIYANDSAGNENTTILTFTFDDILPSIILESPVNGTYFNDSATIDLDISDANLDTVLYNWNGTSNKLLNASLYTVLLPTVNGVHVLYIYAYDNAGNLNTTILTFIFDNISPSMILESPVNGTYFNDSATIDLDISDANLDTVLYNWNGTTNKPLNASLYTVPLPMDNGVHILYIYAYDNAGNLNTTILIFTFDSIVPSIILESPVNGTYFNNSQTIDLDISDTNLDIVLYNWNGTANKPLNGSLYTVPLPTENGVHILYIYAYDSAGNLNTTILTFTFDDISPSIILESPSIGAHFNYNATIDLNITDTNLHIVEYHWDNENNQTWGGSYTTPLPTINSIHNLFIYANDSAGNWNTIVLTFTFDDITASVELLSPANGTYFDYNVTIELNITDTNMDVVQYNWDGLNNQTWSLSNQPVLPKINTVHILYIYANDSAGNLNITILSFTFDDTSPSIILETPTNGAHFNYNATIDLNITDTNLHIVEYHWDNENNQTWSGSYTTPLPTLNSLHNLYIYANDSAGNWNSIVLTFTFDNITPLIILISPVNGTHFNYNATIDLNITDINIDFVLYNWDNTNNQTWSINNPPVLPEINMEHILYIYVNDSAGNLNIAILSFTFDDSDVSIKLINYPENSILKSKTTIVINVTDPNLDVVLFRWDNNVTSEVWSILDQPILPIDDGPHTLFIFANDTSNNWISVSFSFITDDKKPSISLDSIATGSYLNYTATIVLDITDDNPFTILYNWDGNNNQTWSVVDQPILPASNMLHILNVYANDSAGNWESMTFTFTMDDTAPQITLQGIEPGSIIQPGTQIQLSIIDVNLDAVLYNWNNNENITLLSPYIVIQPEEDGVHSLQVYIRDKAGNWNSTTYIFTTDGLDPNIQFTNPQQSSILQPSTIIPITIEDQNEIIEILYNWNGGANQTLLDPSTNIVVPLGDGMYILSIYAKDIAGNWGKQTFEIISDNNKPTIEILSSLIKVSGIISIEIEALDINGIEKVEFIIEGTTIGTLTESSNGIYTLENYDTNSLDDGEHELKIRVTDLAGNFAEISQKFKVENGEGGIPPELIYAIFAIAGLGIAGLGLKFMRGRRFDKALSELEDDFHVAEEFKDGKE